MLSNPGKEVILKAVAQAIPIYAMSVFKIPDFLLDEIHSIFSKFWWGSTGSRRRIHWTGWEDLCLPKVFRGMRFINLKIFNVALLAKQCWRMLKEKDSLLHRVFKAKYFSKCSFLEAYTGGNASYTWRSLWGPKSLLLEGLQWRIGNGRKVKAWDDKWLQTQGVITRPFLGVEFNPDLLVHALIDDSKEEWNAELIKLMFSAEAATEITKIPLSTRDIVDTLIWWPNKRGCFTVKTAYWLGMLGIVDYRGGNNMMEDVAWWKKVWSLNILPKMKHFL